MTTTALFWFLVSIAMWVPRPFRPGVVIVLAGSLVWLVVVLAPPGLRVCLRVAAVAIDGAVGVVLLPEFVVSTARRRNGSPPPAASMVIGAVAERILDAAAALYEANRDVRITRRRYSWQLAAVAIGVPAATYWLRAALRSSEPSDVPAWLDALWHWWRSMELAFLRR